MLEQSFIGVKTCHTSFAQRTLNSVEGGKPCPLKKLTCFIVSRAILFEARPGVNETEFVQRNVLTIVKIRSCIVLIPEWVSKPITAHIALPLARSETIKKKLDPIICCHITGVILPPSRSFEVLRPDGKKNAILLCVV